jgi:peptidoglycan/LPS O-acetylase OafA/YrhL
MAAVILVHGSPNVGWEPRTFPLGFVAVTFGFGLGTWLYRCRLSVPRLPIGVLAVMLLAVLLLPALYAPFQAVALFVIFPFIILSGSRDTSQSRLCRVGGELSYPFYLVHWPVYVMVGRLAHGWTAVAVAMPLSLAVAYGATRFYDAPIRTWFSSLARRGREGAPSGSTSATALDVEVLEESATAI